MYLVYLLRYHIIYFHSETGCRKGQKFATENRRVWDSQCDRKRSFWWGKFVIDFSWISRSKIVKFWPNEKGKRRHFLLNQYILFHLEGWPTLNFNNPQITRKCTLMYRVLRSTKVFYSASGKVNLVTNTRRYDWTK